MSILQAQDWLHASSTHKWTCTRTKNLHRLSSSSVVFSRILPIRTLPLEGQDWSGLVQVPSTNPKYLQLPYAWHTAFKALVLNLHPHITLCERPPTFNSEILVQYYTVWALCSIGGRGSPIEDSRCNTIAPGNGCSKEFYLYFLNEAEAGDESALFTQPCRACTGIGPLYLALPCHACLSSSSLNRSNVYGCSVPVEETRQRRPSLSRT